MMDRMIFIVVKFIAKPEYVDSFLSEVDAFTQATRAEEGNLWFDWSRSADNPAEYVLVEAFRDAEAGGAHVQSQHFQDAMVSMKPLIAKTPDIINVEVPGTTWSSMGELAVD